MAPSGIRQTWGRFTQVDPLHVGAATTDPQQWNRYAYAKNNPLAYGDLSGEFAIALFWIAAPVVKIFTVGRVAKLAITGGAAALGAFGPGIVKGLSGGGGGARHPGNSANQAAGRAQPRGTPGSGDETIETPGPGNPAPTPGPDSDPDPDRVRTPEATTLARTAGLTTLAQTPGAGGSGPASIRRGGAPASGRHWRAPVPDWTYRWLRER